MKLNKYLQNIVIIFLFIIFCSSNMSHNRLLPNDWYPKHEADLVLEKLVKVTAPEVKGAHDSHFIIVEEQVFIVFMVNGEKPGENPAWPFVEVSLTVLNKRSLQIEKIIPVAKGGQVFENETLPVGACFVPRIIRKNDKELRCFFSSEDPGHRQSQVWYIDFNIKNLTFDKNIYRPKLQTSAGIFDMQPHYFHADAARYGFPREAVDYGFYPFEFKMFDNQMFVVLNNFPGGQNAFASLNESLDTFQILGHYNKPYEVKLTESSVDKLPNDTWMAICRQEGGNRNYFFSTSKNGKHWKSGKQKDFVQNGTSSKPTFNRFNGIYYLGWQEAITVNGVFRSVFNIDVSTDCKNWERKYRFETEESFQYPSFYEDKGTVWFSVTQGSTDPSRKERIMFGRLE